MFVYGLSIQTTIVCGTVWPQFVMQVLTGGCEPLVWMEGVVIGGWACVHQVAYRLP